jgi:hypothetical protein
VCSGEVIQAGVTLSAGKLKRLLNQDGDPNTFRTKLGLSSAASKPKYLIFLK